jgi:hypothetical protein
MGVGPTRNVRKKDYEIWRSCQGLILEGSLIAIGRLTPIPRAPMPRFHGACREVLGPESIPQMRLVSWSSHKCEQTFR